MIVIDKVLRFVIGADSSKYERAVNNSRQKSRQFANDASSGFNSVSKTITAMGTAAAATAGVAGIGALTVAINKTVDAASELQETVSKSNTLFGSREIVRWAESAASAMGMSQQAALENSGTMGNMFLQLGSGVSEAEKLSTGMVQLSSDIASFHNVAGGGEAVLLSMQSAFRGEYDALQRYIPTINAAAVEHEALAETGKKTTKELTAMEKAMAVHSIIMRDAGAAVGDFSRTGDQYANTTRRLNSEWEDLSATIGNKFIDAATKAKGATADLIAEMSNFFKGPSLEDQIAQTQAKIAALMDQQNAIEEDMEAKRAAREARRQAEIERFVRSNTGPMNTESAKVLQAFTERQRVDMLMTPTELELKNAQIHLEYLNDLKKFQDMTAHSDKMAALAGVVPEEAIKAATDKELADLVAKEEAKFQIAMDAQTRLDEALTEAAGLQNEMEFERIQSHLEGVTGLQRDYWQIQIDDQARVFNESYKMQKTQENLRKKLREAGNKQALADASSFLSAMGQSNETFFRAWQALEVTKAIVSTYGTAQIAYQHGMTAGGPYAGPYLAAAYAAAAVAAGLANVHAIMSASPGASTVSTAAYSSGTAGAVTSSSDAVTTYDVATTTTEEETKGSYTIIFEGDIYGDDYFIEKLAERISDAVETYDVRLVATSAKSLEN